MAIITDLTLYPIKSCAGISLREATLTAAGLMSEHIYDREWMVVDANGAFMTQRQHPKMALITPRIKADTLELRAPGMLRLEIPLGLPAPEDEATLNVRVWDATVPAYDCDETTATWFSKFLGTPCRLVRFHADAKRIASMAWTDGVEAPTLFSDGFPLLVISEASLADLNDKLKAHGRAPLPMRRFRPNIVISGIEAFEEDYAASLAVGAARLKPVKPCARCQIPSVDETTGEFGPDPLDILRTYRANPKVDGGIAFGMNTIVLEGTGEVLRIGQELDVSLAF
ncbi:MAG TPA: MOSC N-terminal beta barrel domain-containing protein [Noviherbaspirillum sp.]